MKQISKWSLLGYVIGGLFAIFSALRYFIVWPDTDKALVYVTIGMLICAVSWLYNKTKSLDNSIEAVEIYLDDKFNKND